MSVKTELFGYYNQQEVHLYTINTGGIIAKITDFGASLVSLYIENNKNQLIDIVLGYDNLDGYLENSKFFGSTIVPNANRIENASFVTDNNKYHLEKNEGENNLHSHLSLGSHKRLRQLKTFDENSLTLELFFNDLELGFPGNRIIDVTYSIEDGNTLCIEYSIYSDKTTIFNPTNHSYFNLAGHDSGLILNQMLQLKCSYFIPVKQGLIPLGEIESVENTPLDFIEEKTIGKDLNIDYPQLAIANGYDHNFIIDSYDGKLKHFASLTHPTNGVSMHGYTTMPAVQVYSGNYLGDILGKGNVYYKDRYGICFETQYYPNSINQDNFPSPIIQANKWYTYRTEFEFVVEK